MANSRLPFLWPQFFRAVRACEPSTYRSIRSPPSGAKSARKARFHSASAQRQEAIVQRYGQAATQNLPPPGKPEESPSLKNKQEAELVKPEEQKTSPPPSKDTETEQHVGQDEPQECNTASDYVDEASLDSESKHEVKISEEAPLENKELDIVLSIPSPAEVKGKDSSRHPHLEPSPYEHHFDTYSLVQQLASKEPPSYNEEQSITLMKAIRLMLAMNLDVAKEGLVSKSDIENESYLFRAACSELRTTLQTTRHSETLKQRSQRAQLQHEFDILNQKVTQDLLTLREELKGLFNDRKLGLQEEKRKIDGKIQELNYEITVLLNSEAKSEVEGLRWVLTRRAAFAIGVCAFMIISTLNYSSIKSREREEAEKKRQAAAKAQEEKIEAARYTTPSRAQGTQTAEYEESLG